MAYWKTLRKMQYLKNALLTCTLTAKISPFLVLLIILCIQTPITGTSSPISGANSIEYLALLAIKSNIIHDPQHALGSWNSSLHFCQWEGVTCSRQDRRVTVLDLSSRGLSGSLSPHIGNLSRLRELRLQNNTLEGVIPPQLGGLFRLQILLLNNNSFQGEIPASLSNCTSLTDLRVSRNKLVGKLPQELSSLVKLEMLVIHVNNFRGGIPPYFGNLTSLKAISALGNPLGGSIPHALGQLQNLQQVGFGENQLFGIIPPSFYNISSLSIIDVSDNQLNGDLPPEIGLKLPRLQTLYIWGNQLDGKLPVSIDNCSELQFLDVSDNYFDGKMEINFGKLPNLGRCSLMRNNFGSGEPDEMNFIVSMVNCSKLEWLGLNNNRLQGELPNAVANLSTQLTLLSFANNMIYGSIPPGIGNLQSLEALALNGNQFTGSLPRTLGNLKMLKILYVGENSVSGIIPDTIGNLSLLIRLTLQNNRFEGKIPPTLGECQNLLLLNLSGNTLNGSIPRELFRLSSLSISLNLARNHLVGELPEEIRNLGHLRDLDVSHNDLVGEIPNGIGSCTSLEYSSLGGNLFQGLLPPSMSYLTGIRKLDLSSNNFSGEIPRFLEQLNFSYLNLSFNNFEGQVPSKGVFGNADAVSISGNNKLCGGLPEFQLPECVPARSKKGQKIVISIVCSLVALGVVMGSCLLFYLQKRKRKAQLELPMLQSFTTVSYGVLLKATDHFSSEKLIGVGSFSSVYKGIIEQGETMVAIKVLNLQKRGALRSFMAECEILRNIRHRNLVKIVTCCSSFDFNGNDFKALVYEFMPNGSLENWLHPSVSTEDDRGELQRLGLLQIIDIATQVAHGIDYLHHQCEPQVIHCDLKPSNILLDEEMVAHLGDFGLARILLPELPNTSGSNSIGIRGTIGYAAPEYGLGSEASRQGDVYSYGILLLEMMTGKRPTHPMFQEGLNLHKLAAMALPDHVMEIIDPLLLASDNEDAAAADCNHDRSAKQGTNLFSKEECITSIVKIGVACSSESPYERMDISQVIHDLHYIKRMLLGTRTLPLA